MTNGAPFSSHLMVNLISFVLITGGTAASIISFILPGMFAQKMKDRSGNNTSRVGKVFVWGGLVIGILTTGTTLYGIFDNESVDGTTCNPLIPTYNS